MHDSAVAILWPSSRLASCSSIVASVAAEQEAPVALLDARRSAPPARPRRPDGGGHRSRARPAQAGGDLEPVECDPLRLDLEQASWRSRTPGRRTGAASSPRRARRGPSTACAGSVASAAGHIALQLARRARHHDHRRPVVNGHDEPGRGPGRVDRGRALGHHRLLAVRLAQRVGSKPSRRANPARISAIFDSMPSSRTSSRPANRATTSAVRSSAVGPSPPLVTIRSIAVVARGTRSVASRSSGRSATTRMCDDLHARARPGASRSTGRCGP